jgi:exosome complex component CSL4
MPVKKNASGLVFPGSVLCTEEEFAPGSNAFSDETGNIISTAVGEPVFDSKKRIVTIERRTRSILPIQPGSVLVGKVVLVKDNAAVIEPISSQKNGMEVVHPNSTVAIPVSRMDRAFVESAKQKFKAGDIVVGLVERVERWGIDLNTSSTQFGVLKAFCTRCRSPMRLEGRQLKCTKCGNAEFRKIASSYWIQ